MGDRPIVSLCGSRNRLTGLGLSGVCAAGRRGLLTVHVCIYYEHNVHKKYVQNACMHACPRRRNVGRKVYWTGRAVLCLHGCETSSRLARVRGACCSGFLIFVSGSRRFCARRPFSSPSSRLVSFVQILDDILPPLGIAVVSTTDGPAMVSRGGRMSYGIRGPRNNWSCGRLEVI